MKPIPKILRPLLEEARTPCVPADGTRLRRACRACLSTFRDRIRAELWIQFGYVREERRQLRRETRRALEAARRQEAAGLLGPWSAVRP